MTARQGALLHRRGFSWERRFGGLAGACAGKTKDHTWERNSVGPRWWWEAGGPVLPCPPSQRHRPSAHVHARVTVCAHVCGLAWGCWRYLLLWPPLWGTAMLPPTESWRAWLSCWPSSEHTSTQGFRGWDVSAACTCSLRIQKSEHVISI